MMASTLDLAPGWPGQHQWVWSVFQEKVVTGHCLLFRWPWGFPGGTSGKEPVCQCRRERRSEFDPWMGKIPWRRAWQPTPVFLSGEFYGQRRLAGYSP